jgi:hypothetical protein
MSLPFWQSKHVYVFRLKDMLGGQFTGRQVLQLSVRSREPNYNAPPMRLLASTPASIPPTIPPQVAGTLHSVSLTPDGSLLATGGEAKLLKIWNLERLILAVAIAAKDLKEDHGYRSRSVTTARGGIISVCFALHRMSAVSWIVYQVW